MSVLKIKNSHGQWEQIASVKVVVDKTLTKANAAADAKVTGDEFKKIENTIDVIYDPQDKHIYVTIDGVKRGAGVDITDFIEGTYVDVNDLLIYFRNNVLDAINYVKSMPERSVSHVCATDIHYNTNYRHSAAICNLLMDSGLFDKLMILGDLTDDNTQAQYDNFIADGWGEHNGEILFAIGNHDVRTPTGDYPTYSDFYNDFLSKATYGNADTMYYTYTDYTHKIIYVVLNTETLTASSDDPQIQMLTNAVSKEGWTVFVLAHRNMAVLPDGITWAQSLPNNTTATLKTAIEGGVATIGGYICGHQHVDIFTPVDGKFFHVTLLNDRNETQNYYPGYSVTSRAVGTVNEQAISIITIDPVALEVYVYRIGAAYSTRNWHYIYASKSGTLPTQPSDHAVSNNILLSTANANNKHFFADEAEYSTRLVPQTGFFFGNAKVVMGDADVTDSVLDYHDVIIPSVAGDVLISAYSHALEGNIINWERYSNASGNGAVTINKATNHVGWETPGSTRALCFAINGLAADQCYDVEFTPDEGYETDNGVKINVNTAIDSAPSISSDPELTKTSIGAIRRGVVVPDGMKTLKVALYRPGVIIVKKRDPEYGKELFVESGLEAYKWGDANYTFNADGSITITGTPPANYSDKTNRIFFALRDIIVNGNYRVKVTSNANARGNVNVFARDWEVPSDGTTFTTYGAKDFNSSVSVINYDDVFVNNPGSSVLGRGTMGLWLSAGATFTVSVKLVEAEE